MSFRSGRVLSVVSKKKDYWMHDLALLYVRAEEIINKLISILESESPFALFENNGAITKGLLKVYRHVLTQDWKRKM